MFFTKNLLKLQAWLNAFNKLDLEHASPKYLKSIEVAAPLASSSLDPVCKIEIANTQFANSYGKPFVGEYIPNFEECGLATQWTSITLHYQGNISGRQFDRLGGVWLSGHPLLRYTGAEPSGASITTWDLYHDVSEYMTLFSKNQSVVVSLDNVVDQTYTGIFNVTVELYFYAEKEQKSEAKHPDLVIPLSASIDSYGWFTLPVNEAPLYVTIPRLPENSIKAEVKVYVSGHGQDEFWYGNVPTGVANNAGLYGGGAFKEIQLYIDDRLVGADWPFSTIYTGGINPLLWRPVVAIGAFHVPEMVFDITPLLPLLFDGKDHRIGFNVTNAANSYWLIDANLKVWTDAGFGKDHRFQGVLNSLKHPVTTPSEEILGDINSTLTVKTNARNRLYASGSIYTSKGWIRTETHTVLNFWNHNVLRAQANNETMSQNTEIYRAVTTTSFFPFSISLELEKASYPISLTLNVTNQGPAFQFDTFVDHGVHISKGSLRIPSQSPESFKRPSSILAHSILAINQVAKGGFGTIPSSPLEAPSQNQSYSFKSPTSCYHRNLQVDNRDIIFDEESFSCNDHDGSEVSLNLSLF